MISSQPASAWRVRAAQVMAAAGVGLFVAMTFAQPTINASSTPSVSPINQARTFTTCKLESVGNEFRGTCEIPCMVNSLWIDIDGATPGRSCASPMRTVKASLKKTDRSQHWLGTMEGKEPEDPTRFELLMTQGAGGTAKMPYGWYRVDSANVGEQSIYLTIAADKTLPPTQDDLRILDRAIALLPNDAAWNKADTRQCPKDQAKLSVFCALIQATNEISGGYHYRQPAMQAVREVVNEFGGTRVDKHRLMDYNNHPETTLAEIHTMLRMAKTKVEARFR